MEQSKNGVSVTLKTITPELAQQFLCKTVRNRKITQGVVDFYVNQMRSGQWRLTGDSIKFSVDDVLMDGQHRLKAIIAYGKPIDIFVTEGLEPETFDVLDTGKSRTAGDLLSVFGVEKANNIAAIVRFIVHFKRGKFSQGYHKRDSVTNHDILEFVNKHPGLNEVLNFVHLVYRDFRFVPVSILGGLYFLFAEKNQSKADQFFTQYRTGLDLQKGSPVYLLRDKLLRDQTNKTKFTQRQKVALFIVAWNNFIQGKELSKLILSEEFPKII